MTSKRDTTIADFIVADCHLDTKTKYRKAVSQLKRLLKASHDVNGARRGASPLWLAARAGYQEMVALLVDAGADLEKEHEGRTPLLVAADGAAFSPEGYNETFACLLAAGANVNAKDKAGDTPLHMLARAGRTRPVKKLLRAGADVHGQGLADETPLVAAAREGHLTTVKAIVAAGASIDVVPARQRTLAWFPHAKVNVFLNDAGASPAFALPSKMATKSPTAAPKKAKGAKSSSVTKGSATKPSSAASALHQLLKKAGSYEISAELSRERSRWELVLSGDDSRSSVTAMIGKRTRTGSSGSSSVYPSLNKALTDAIAETGGATLDERSVKMRVKKAPVASASLRVQAKGLLKGFFP